MFDVNLLKYPQHHTIAHACAEVMLCLDWMQIQLSIKGAICRMWPEF